jgi:MerR family transcriptional regulator, light-induced transcriptional regulator
MNRYSISDLEQLSGIKAHTIRVWERRYKGLKPMRSEGNTRYYDDKQLKRLLNVVSLSDTGRKISELFSLSETGLNALIDEQIEVKKPANPQFEHFIAKMIVEGLSYNEAEFEKYFSACLVRYGMRETYMNIIYPMLVRIALIWGQDVLCPAQEHFMSNLIKQKLLAAIDGLAYPANDKKPWLLFLPEEEYHEIGLLFASYLIRLSGHKTIYLGSNVPFDSLKEAVRDTNPANMLCFMVHNRHLKPAQDYINNLSTLSKDIKIHLAGHEKLISQLKLKKNVDWIKSVSDLEKKLK